MALVIDGSVALSWCFPDEKNADSDAILQLLADQPGVAPDIFWYEIRNALIVSERRGRITASGSAEFLADLNALGIALAAPGDEAVVMSLARDHQLSVYDAAYLELAKREGHTLCTFDEKLRAAARKSGMQLLPA